MGLSDAIQIGRSALTASQLGIQTASNNLANVSTPGYSRRTLGLSSVGGASAISGRQIGLGVEVGSVRRSVDEALLTRINTALGDESAAQARADILSEIEANLNELTDGDLSSELSAFFSAWSELSNGSENEALVVEQGVTLAGVLSRTREDLVRQRDTLDDQLASGIEQVNTLLGEVGRINSAITTAEVGGGDANALRDQRDQLLRELSGYLDITTVARETGGVDVLVGSTPLVQGSRVRAVEVRREPRGGEVVATLRVVEDGTALPVSSGRIGALVIGRDDLINATIDDLDELASSLIFEVNRLHSTGTNASGLTSAEATRDWAIADQGLALNDPRNATASGLRFDATNGGFSVVVTDRATGATRTTRIDVDLDGIDAAGARGFGDDTSLADIASAIDAVAGLSASIGPSGRLSINAASGFEFSLSDDTSGALAVLGVNGYFEGSDASDIGVTQRLQDNPQQLVSGRLDRSLGFADNGTALEIAALQDRGLASLGGRSVGGFWRDRVQSVGGQASAALGERDSLQVVREGLDNQRLALSGVNEDEEAVSLLTFQRQFQGAARVIQTADELLQELLALV